MSDREKDTKNGGPSLKRIISSIPFSIVFVLNVPLFNISKKKVYRNHYMNNYVKLDTLHGNNKRKEERLVDSSKISVFKISALLIESSMMKRKPVKHCHSRTKGQFFKVHVNSQI